MAASEYVSVSSQSDTENADLDKERVKLEQEPAHDDTALRAEPLWNHRRKPNRRLTLGASKP